MKSKLLNLSVIISSLIGYLEWGTNNRMFLFQGEIEVLTKLFNDPASAIHPFTLLPLIGQVLLVFTLFQERPGKVLTYLGIGCIGLLLGFMFFIAMISLQYKIFLSTIPFMVAAVMAVRHHRRKDE